MSQIPYITKYATDVYTPEKGIAVGESRFTPPASGGGTISCAGAGNSVALITYIRDVALSDPSLETSLINAFERIKCTINGIELDLTVYEDNLEAVYGIRETPRSGTENLPVIEGYIAVDGAIWTNISDQDIRISIDYSDGNEQALVRMILAGNDAVNNGEGDVLRSTGCISARAGISCDGAKSTTPCFVLTGDWDLEVDGEIIADQVSEQDILELFGMPILAVPLPPVMPSLMSVSSLSDSVVPILVAERCMIQYVCTPSGRWEFSNDTLNMALINSGSKDLHMFLEESYPEGYEPPIEDEWGNPIENNLPQVRHFSLRTLDNGGVQVYDHSNDWSDYDSDPPNDGVPLNPIQHYDVLVSPIGNSVLRQDTQPYNYHSLYRDSNYCDAQGAKYQFKIGIQNVSAINKARFHYYNWYGNSVGYVDYDYTNNVYRLKMGTSEEDMVELTPYTFTTTTDTASVERAVLNHFASQITARGATCRIVEERWQVVPSAFDASRTPSVNSMYLLIETNQADLVFLAPKQKNGTASNPQDRNVYHGFEYNNPGLLTGSGYGGYNEDSSGIRPVGFVDCVGGLIKPYEIGYRSEVVGASRATANNTQYWQDKPTQFRLLSFEEAGYTPGSNEVNIVELFNIPEDERTIINCGSEERPPE